MGWWNFFIFYPDATRVGCRRGLEAEECDNPSAIPGLFWRASPAKLDYVEHTGKERLSS